MIPISSPVDEGSAEKKPNSKSEAAAITSHRGGNHKPSRKGKWSQLNPAACSVPPRKNASQFSTSLCFLPPPPSQPRRADRRPMTLPRRRHSDTTTATTRHRRTRFVFLLAQSLFSFQVMHLQVLPNFSVFVFVCSIEYLNEIEI
nr:hypothetical protein Itr_chr02CG16090 [Ipomoea trifida]